MVGIAVALIVLAIILALLGVFTEGIGILFWLGVGVLVLAVIAYAAGGRRGGPPL